ncbi:UpxY family transcription antiterminator [candidate division KSB1 bacterium]|nr:UpxY family transcription antiterminator [candidate division KSB1 bacterium]
MSIEKELHWYAFVTKPRHEKKVKSYMDSVGITNFLPLRKTLRQWKDRRRWVEMPLFSCYIFCQIEYIYRYDVLKLPSVVRVVSFNQQPTPVRQQEIEAIQRLLRYKEDVFVGDGLVPGDRVRISTGPLHGLEGVLSEQRGNKWFVVYISAIGKSVYVDIQENVLEKI